MYVLTVHVHNRQVGTADNHALAHNETETSCTSSDDTDLTLQREGGEGPLHMLATAPLDGNGGRKLALLRVLNCDGLVRSGEATRHRGTTLGRLGEGAGCV